MIASATAVDPGYAESELMKFDSVDAWANGRNSSIGSSDAAIILREGYASSSIYSLWAEKCHGITPEFKASTLKLFEVGKINEPYLAKRCELEYGWKVHHDPQPSFRRNRRRTYMTASLDGWMIEDGQHVAIEMKGINAFSIRSEWDVHSGKAPLKYTIQLQHQLAVTGWGKGYLVALSGLDVYKIEVQRHEGLIKMMLDEYDDFWKLVKSKKEPEIDDSEATCLAINRVYTRQPQHAQHLDDEESALIDNLFELESNLKTDQKRLAKYQNELAAIAKGADYVVTSDGVMYSYMVPKNGVKRVLKLYKRKG